MGIIRLNGVRTTTRRYYRNLSGNTTVANTLKFYFFRRKQLLIFFGFLIFIYTCACSFLFAHQRYLIFRPSPELKTLPSSPEFKRVRIPIANSRSEYLSGWWFDAPLSKEKINVVANEPANKPAKTIRLPKTILYFCGAAGNKSFRSQVKKFEELRKLGFSVLVIDYRGFGESEGKQYPNESQFYQDSQTAWNYLVKNQNIQPKDIVIYGESLGGAIAIDLAVKHPEVGGLIIQSSFTSMAKTIKHHNLFSLFPIDLLLTQRFNSISKVPYLKVPVLFIHGTADTVVPYDMSKELYNAAPVPKKLLLIPEVGHFDVYENSSTFYLRGIKKFTKGIESR